NRDPRECADGEGRARSRRGYRGRIEAVDRRRSRRHGLDVQGARRLRSEARHAAGLERPARPERGFLMLVSSLLAAIPGLRHAFFTREGGVSEGIYDSLNGGLGSRDEVANVAENRRRMAEQLGVEPTHFLNVHQIHSPDVIVATGPWDSPTRPKADAIVT